MRRGEVEIPRRRTYECRGLQGRRNALARRKKNKETKKQPDPYESFFVHGILLNLLA